MENITILLQVKEDMHKEWKIQEQDGIGGKRDINERTGQ
jgi:hypothetical protein